MKNDKKKVLLVPLDPVHDIGLKMIRKALNEKGHQTILLPPDSRTPEVINAAIKNNVDTILISRTVGYGVAELMGNFIDQVEAAGLREKVKVGLGGMAIRPELAAELGFDGGFGPGTTIEEAIAFVEGRKYVPDEITVQKNKKDFTENYSYNYHHTRIKELLDKIVENILDYSKTRITPAIKRAKIREEILSISENEEKELPKLKKAYSNLCDQKLKEFYQQNKIPSYLRKPDQKEVDALENFVKMSNEKGPAIIQHKDEQPLVFVQYGTGCPLMDIAHIKVVEAWGADGVVHFDPSWGARTEGFYEGYLAHEENGTVITSENLEWIKRVLLPGTLWQVRAHRGLNTPETVLLAGINRADLTKVNIAYGSLAAGTDPERLTVDAVAALKYAARFNLPYDIPTNEELAGVPAHKAFAGMLITAHLGLKLGARPILQPLFCYSPQVMLGGQMEDNYFDFNAAKIFALRQIISAPIWPGAPIGFLTHTEERVQSATTTGLHAGLAASLEVDAISVASSDEAYSGGPITVSSRIDSLQSVKENFRCLGETRHQTTDNAKKWSEELVDKIEKVLKQVANRGNFIDSLYQGDLGNREDGAYPGRYGRGTVKKIKG